MKLGLVLAMCIGVPNIGMAQQIVMRLASDGAPGDPYVQILGYEFAKKVGEKSGGRVRVDVFPSAQLGSGRAMLEGVEMGSIDIALSVMGRLEHYTPIGAVADFPYMIRDRSHFEKVFHGPVGREYIAAVEKESGLRMISVGWWGPRNLQTTRPVRSLKDLKGLKVRVPPLPLYVEAWKRLGASPTPMDASEIYMGLKQGVIQGQENPLTLIYNLKWHEVAKFISSTEHILGNIVHLMSKKRLEALPADVRKIVEDTATETALTLSDKTDAVTLEVMEKMKATGVEFLSVDKKEWMAALDGMINSYPKLMPWYQKIVAVK
jgi:tripartite ATP-independent transporter DctP family solute receptor